MHRICDQKALEMNNWDLTAFLYFGKVFVLYISHIILSHIFPVDQELNM